MPLRKKNFFNVRKKVPVVLKPGPLKITFFSAFLREAAKKKVPNGPATKAFKPSPPPSGLVVKRTAKKFSF